MGPLGYMGRDHFTSIDEELKALAVRLLTDVGSAECNYKLLALHMEHVAGFNLV